MKDTNNQLINILIILLLFAGCSSSPTYVPVRDSKSYSGVIPKAHTVVAGETLYSIAWRYDLDYKLLARANGIGSDYRIFPGQTLRLSEKKRVKKITIIKKPSENVSGVKTSSSVKNEHRSKKTTQNSKTTSQNAYSNGPIRWAWPAEGAITNTFRSNNGLQKGVDIKGKLGESVLAASSGKVVYSGEGLRGYGKLVILKHNEKYLSAYAHNSQLFVEEGDWVKSGQRIAAMGASGTNEVKLHFQIRLKGKPINPLQLLPKKSR